MQKIVLDEAEKDPEIQKAMKVQENIFIHGRQLLSSQLDSIDKQIVQINAQVKASKEQKGSILKQQKLLEQEVSDKTKLRDEGLIPKEALVHAKRNLESILSEYSRLLGDIAAKEAQILEVQMKKISIERDRDERLSRELKDIQLQIAEFQERYNDAAQMLNRTVVTSPSNGTVTDLKVSTISGIISPGQHLMYIVPKNDSKIIEAMVNPNDIINIAVGQKAKVQLTSYKARLVPRIEGEVIYVSEDVIELPPQQQRPGVPPGASFYIAHIAIPQSALDELTEDVRLYPGMPAQVFIITGERTFLQYLMSPITDSFHRAFIEQ